LAVTLKWTRLEPFGVEIERDLSEPLSPPETYHFAELFREHGLILARGQALTMERQRELCGILGPILLRAGEDGYMSNEAGGPSASGLAWHADAAYTDDPFDALSLHALDVVDEASSTRFASAEAAAERLPPTLREALAGREQEMIAVHYTKLEARTCDQREPEAQKRGVQPAIYLNPHNGRPCVWASELQTVRLLEMDWEESRDLLHQVYDHLYAPENVLEHRWRNGDLIIWDNIALQHMRGNIEQVGKRLLQRVIVGKSGVAPHVQE
jgi:taurine dioxygenase